MFEHVDAAPSALTHEPLPTSVLTLTPTLAASPWGVAAPAVAVGNKANAEVTSNAKLRVILLAEPV